MMCPPDQPEGDSVTLVGLFCPYAQQSSDGDQIAIGCCFAEGVFNLPPQPFRIYGPGPTNSKKLRRQIEDALRKTASDGDLVAIAGLLGIRAE